MKHPLLLLMLLSSTGSLRAVAQTTPSASRPTLSTLPTAKGNGRLTGTVVNAKNNQPVEYATVALLDKATDKPLDGGVCDEKGHFSLTKIAAGDYKISISFVGFQSKVIDNVRVADADATVNLGQISLTPSVQQLKEVKVTGERELVENKVDRIVYNAEKDITNTGGTAADVLRKVPLLTVDLDGNVQMRGSSNLRVLINNKPSTIVAASVADALRQIPADQIKSVEVITSPSAKYDAEGTGGVLNIILKKNSLPGVNGSVGASAGTRSSNLNTNLNARREKFGLNANAGSYLFYNRGRGETARTTYLPNNLEASLEQTSTSRTNGASLYGQLGFDYDLTAKDAFSLSGRGNLFRFRNTSDQFSAYTSPLTPSDVYDRDVANRNQNRNIDLNFGYTRTMKPRQELSLLALYSISKGNSDYGLDQFRDQTRLDYREKSFNDNRNREATLQADYMQPVDSTGTLEIGTKMILRDVGSDYQILADSLKGTGYLLIPSRTNEFRYQQNVYAGYLTYAFTWQKVYTFKAGGRLENTHINGDFLTSDATVSQSYTNFVPSVMAARDFGKTKNQKLKLSYSRRIQRPNIYFLNPYVNTQDRRNVRSGNPELNPELTNSYELGYSTYFKTSSINASAYWRQTNNAIEQISQTVPSTTFFPDDPAGSTLLYSTFQNVARNANYGLNLYGSTKVLTKVTVNGSVNGYYQVVRSAALNTTNRGLMFNGNLSTSWQIGKGYSAQFNGFMSSRTVTLQGRSSGFRYYALAMKKELFEKKGSLTLNLENPFGQALVFRNSLATDQFRSFSNNYYYNRSVRLSFNYQFGKADNRPNRPKKSIQNDDQKQGASSQQ
ncbi:outer membrane beta-barrel family protein [Hymenobacter jejuensis]|uniref:TonB-dependent receptor n=1 Tax=Hymenobacter jejuensis TaxID=2502781 RepID=A0A5B7ZV53_9BACT|nr:outer membrane beta-barrel family protein [Hymenobacter jejuensis]QDA59084.1 TonB-dependent receptor [Hymenobacter jejuensis]